MAKKPLLYDLCCGEGGVAYTALALGWEVIGIDIKPQPNYPGKFILANALAPPLSSGADLVWCSPDCQGYSRLAALKPEVARPKIIPQLREVARSLASHFVIENVATCHDLISPIKLCGFMFGLPLIRHRLFETTFLLPQPKHTNHNPPWFQVAGNSKGTLHQWRQAMGLPNLSKYGLTQAVPYAYTWFILTWFTATHSLNHKTIGVI